MIASPDIMTGRYSRAHGRGLSSNQLGSKRLVGYPDVDGHPQLFRRRRQREECRSYQSQKAVAQWKSSPPMVG